ncbi:hypothetical protein PG996_007831 [Apiospora saccharicola]|uniref:Apple domain-containing protein n=1 Tax=Apiospora saccharicola TaxID=335842 RepID=A0ABR1UW75_9PEZI
MQFATVLLGAAAVLVPAVVGKPVSTIQVVTPQRRSGLFPDLDPSIFKPVQQCSRDSLYDLFREDAHTAKASSYCSKLIQASTAIVTATVPFQPTTVYAQTATVTAATTYVTATDTAHATVTVTSVVYTTVTIPTTVVVATSTISFTDTETLTTTDATSFATVQSTTTTTTTDATSTSTQTDLTTTTAASIHTIFIKRQTRDKCGTANWLTTALSNGPSKLSSACSCLLTQASTTVTVTSTEAAITQTSLSTVDFTAVGTETATVTETATTSEITTSTASSTTTIDATATESVTLTITEAKAVTAAGTTTVISTSTIFETDLVSTTVTSTVTATPSPPPVPQCSDIASPYTGSAGSALDLSCDTVYSSAQASATRPAGSFVECINLCDAFGTDCDAANYFAATGTCEILKGTLGQFVPVTDGSASSATKKKVASAPKCADLPNPYNSPQMNTYGLACDRAYDLRSLIADPRPVDSFAACVEVCDGYRGACVALNYDLGAKQCYLLSGYDSLSNVPGFVAASQSHDDS